MVDCLLFFNKWNFEHLDSDKPSMRNYVHFLATNKQRKVIFWKEHSCSTPYEMRSHDILCN